MYSQKNAQVCKFPALLWSYRTFFLILKAKKLFLSSEPCIWRRNVASLVQHTILFQRGSHIIGWYLYNRWNDKPMTLYNRIKFIKYLFISLSLLLMLASLKCASLRMESGGEIFQETFHRLFSNFTVKKARVVVSIFKCTKKWGRVEKNMD